MTECPYCRASNLSDDHRCQRCGRRLEYETAAYRAPRYTRESTARALQYEPEPDISARSVLDFPRMETRDESPRGPVQPFLFQTRVVSFQSFAPESAPARPKSKPTTPRPRTRKSIPGQESFGFDTLITQAPSVSARAATPYILCPARVARPEHRLLAAACDLTVVLVAVVSFLLLFHFAGGATLLMDHALPFSLVLGGVFFFMYQLMWCMAGMDSAGMQWVRLKVVGFDGKRPDQEQRILRAATSCLSVLAAGLGVIWALVDEESLTWHDHISRSFPTPY